MSRELTRDEREKLAQAFEVVSQACLETGFNVNHFHYKAIADTLRKNARKSPSRKVLA